MGFFDQVAVIVTSVPSGTQAATFGKIIIIIIIIILGTLIHCSLTVPEGRSRLPSIATFGASFSYLANPCATRAIPVRVKEDVEWWLRTLNLEFCGSSITPPPAPTDLGLWVDASTSFGVGLFLQGQWRNFQLREGWKGKGRDIGWAEMVAVEPAVIWLIEQEISDTNIIIRSDNTGVIGGLRLGRSRNPQQNTVIQRITSLIASHHLWLTPVYVTSGANLADRPSRGLEPSNCNQSSSKLNLPPELAPFLYQI